MNVAISVAIFGIAWLSRKAVGNWLNPTSIFLLFSFFYTAIPILSVADIPIYSWSILFIFTYCALFSSSIVFFNWKLANKSNLLKSSFDQYISVRDLKNLVYLFSITGTLSLLYNISVNLPSILSMASLVEVNATYTDMRYSGAVDNTVWGTIGLISAYLAAVLGGLLIGTKRATNSNTILIFTFLPSLLLLLVQGSKGMLFISIFMFLGSFVVSQIYRNNFILINRKRANVILIGGALLVCVLAFSFYSRGLYNLPRSEMMKEVLIYFNSYANGHLFAFSDWYSSYLGDGSVNRYDHNVRTYGFYTFKSVFQLFGDDRYVPPGNFDEFLIIEGVLKSNIYMFYRGLIMDFGVLGALVFGWITGFITNFSFYVLLTKRFSPFAICFFVFSVTSAYLSYITSLFNWKSIIVLFFALYLILWFFKIQSRVNK